MKKRDVHMVTGAFGNSGGYTAEKLLETGLKVETLTNSPRRPSPLLGRLAVHPLCFNDVPALARSLSQTKVLYNNYWVRYNADNFSYAGAVENSGRLFAAAKKAGVKRIVQVSITNPDLNSPYEYFSGKAKLEQALVASGVSHTILRPALLFGPEDILINNIAWMLRKMPIYGIFGDGKYRVQPIFVEDLAGIAVKEGRNFGCKIINTIGPETFTFRNMVETLSMAIGVRKPILPIPPLLGWAAGCVMGLALRDDIITWQEIRALMEDRLYVSTKPTGRTKLSVWARRNRHTLGLIYANELARRRNRETAYGLAKRGLD